MCIESPFIRKCTKAERIAREAAARKKTYAEVEEKAKRIAKMKASGITWEEHFKEQLQQRRRNKEEEGRDQEK